MRLPPRKLLLAVASFPLWLVIVELGYRGWLALSHKGYAAANTRAALLGAESKMTEAFMTPDRKKEELSEDAARSLATITSHPFAGVESAVAFDFFSNDLKTCLPGRGPSEYVILLLGGSVANMFSPEGSDLLCGAIAADPRFRDKHVTLLNYARAGMKQPQQTAMAAWLFSAGFRPNAVINLDGYNETALFHYNVEVGAHPLYPFFTMWGHVANQQNTDSRHLDEMLAVRALQRQGWKIAHQALELHAYESAVIGNLTLMRLAEIRSDVARAYKAYTASVKAAPENKLALGPAYARDPESLDRMMVGCWMESSLSLRGVCAARDVYYLHVLQPTLHDVGSKPVTQAEIDSGGLDTPLMLGVQHGYPLLRSAGKELVERGVNFADASDTFAGVKEPIYYDFCHFKGLGNRLLAARIAREFLRALPTAVAEPGVATSK